MNHKKVLLITRLKIGQGRTKPPYKLTRRSDTIQHTLEEEKNRPVNKTTEKEVPQESSIKTTKKYEQLHLNE